MSGRNPNILEGADDHAKLQDLCTRTYKEQMVWFMNAFWEEIVEADSERFWNYKHKMDELDLQDHEMGSALDEMKAHVFLEHFKETQTVREMRTNLRASGAIGEKERPKNVPLTHFLLFRYKVDWHQLVNASQGDNSKELAEAQAKLEAAQAACEEAQRSATEAANKLREAIQKEGQAKADAEAAAAREKQAYADAEAAKARQAEAEAAQRELEAALAELKAQEDAYNNKTKELEQKSETGGVVSRNKAKNELAQHLGEDPLPLRRAKITQEAAVKKADRATQAAADARAAAEASAAAATEAREAADASARAAAAARAESEQAKAAAEAALNEARARFAEAEAYLAEVKAQAGGTGQGSLFWIERELLEARKFMPESKGGISRKK